MSRLISTLICLLPALVWAEGEPAVIGEWQTVLEKEVCTLEQAEGLGRDVAGAVRGACHKAVQAAKDLREAQAAYCEECLYLYADVYRPEQDVIDLMRAAFMRRVDDCLRQDLRDVVTFCPWCRRVNHGFWLRTPADAAMWLTGPAPAQPRAITHLFAGRDRGTPAALDHAGATAWGLHRRIVQFCAAEIASTYQQRMVYEPLTGAEPIPEQFQPQDIRSARAAFDKAEEVWQAYCDAVAALVSPHHAATSAGYSHAAYSRRLLDKLYASHLHYLTLISDGVRSGANTTRKLGTFQVSTGQLRYPFGEIFHDYAMLFRHPGLPDKPWCLTMSGPSSPDAEFTWTIIASCPELDAYAAKRPEGGLVFVHGYFDVEVTGKPYEPVNRPADSNGVIPDPRPADAYTIRPVLRVISLMPLKW